ncbi:MAG: DHH family phosphoesterase [Planctomycetes bacterium]|nr:DHH family phosphoesterase [Planctomycetota bacterium]
MNGSALSAMKQRNGVQHARTDGRTTAELIRLLATKQRLLVLTHANPDPDSLASAAGLVHLARTRLGMDARFAFSGRIMRAENCEMVRACAIEMTPQDQIDVSQYDCLAVVDTQPGFGHTHLPPGRAIDIVVDHHVPPKIERPVAPIVFNDVRLAVGATSSIVTGYLMDAGVEVPGLLATALFYGLLTDTADLSRDTSALDVRAYEYLAPRVDRAILRAIQKPELSSDYYRTLREALNSVRIYGGLVLCSLGRIKAPEMVAEVADLLMRLEGKQTVICGGLVGATYYVSLRTELARDAYDILGAALDGEGSFGGHGRVAGGSVKLPDDDERTVKRFERRLEKNALEALGLEGTSVAGLGGTKD